ncbi:hypothetical protein GQX74_011632 [Glossina fuscipes]|nr:hypothetical protein GQX74_011632 [Glossina fuscipes]
MLLLALSDGKAKLSALNESDVSSFLLRISASFPISTTPSGCVLESTACVATCCEHSTGLSSECTLLPTVISSVDLFWKVTDISSSCFISSEGFCLPVVSPQLLEMTGDEHHEYRNCHFQYLLTHRINAVFAGKAHLKFQPHNLVQNDQSIGPYTAKKDKAGTNFHLQKLKSEPYIHQDLWMPTLKGSLKPIIIDKFMMSIMFDYMILIAVEIRFVTNK